MGKFDTIVKALSIRQPWAWLIANGLKDCENRTWGINIGPERMPILIHASKTMTRADYENALLTAIHVCRVKGTIKIPNNHFPTYDELLPQCGGIVGETTVWGCVSRWDSPWFFGPKALLLQDSRPLPFHPCPGRLKFFDVEYPEPEGAIAW